MTNITENDTTTFALFDADGSRLRLDELGLKTAFVEDFTDFVLLRVNRDSDDLDEFAAAEVVPDADGVYRHDGEVFARWVQTSTHGGMNRLDVWLDDEQRWECVDVDPAVDGQSAEEALDEWLQHPIRENGRYRVEIVAGGVAVDSAEDTLDR